MKRKVRKFQEGGFSAAQEEWLGGADRTDPYILARMRKAVPDAPKSSTPAMDTGELRDETGMVSKIKRNTETGDLYSTEAPTPGVVEKTTTTVKTAKPSVKPVATGPSKEEMDAERKRMEEIGKKQGLKGFYPEEMLIGGGAGGAALKALQIAGKKLAGKLGSRLKTYTPSEYEAMTPKLGRESLKLGMKKGGSVKKMASGGKVSSASKRADGCAIKGKTRGRIM